MLLVVFLQSEGNITAYFDGAGRIETLQRNWAGRFGPVNLGKEGAEEGCRLKASRTEVVGGW
jgi:hypothetical protein